MNRFAVVGAVLTAGCVNVQQIPMSSASSEAINGKVVALSKWKRPDFLVVTPGAALTRWWYLWPPEGYRTVGSEIVAQNNVEDPAARIGEALIAQARSKYGLKVIPEPVPLDSEEILGLSKANPGVDLLLDVRTVHWVLASFPTDWSKCRVIYTAKLRLIDLKHGRVLAEATCGSDPEETPASPSYDELLANGADRLKKELRDAADRCVSELRSKTLF